MGADDPSVNDLVNGLPRRRTPKGMLAGGATPPPTPPLVPPTPPARQSPRKRVIRPQRRASPSAPPVPPAPPELSRRPSFKHYRVPRWLFWVMLICAVGFAWKGTLTERGSEKSTATQAGPAPPAATVTVTATVTVEVLPESCRKALVLLRSIIEDVDALNGRSTAQIDIASDANQAIFLKNWAKLRDIQERQRILMGEQQDAYHDFKSKYKPALDAMAQCEKDGK